MIDKNIDKDIDKKIDKKISRTVEQSPYVDIINREHSISNSHKRMSLYNRAAQFSPFAAVSGYDGAVKETARLTERRIELDESEKTILDEKLSIIRAQLNRKQQVEFVFFQPDERKVGGAYRSIRGVVKKIEGYERVVVMADETKIPIEEIVDIIGEIFQNMDDYFA